MKRIETIEQVVNYQLCTGCGMCASAEPSRYKMTDVETYGKRPILVQNPRKSNGSAFSLCPGIHLDIEQFRPKQQVIKELEACWGPVLGIWEGCAADEEIRYKGSSGGVCTALSLFGIESGRATVVLQTGMDKSEPHLNETQASSTREQLVQNAGSRYSPASPCEGIHNLEEGERAIFVGKPCDVAAVRKLQQRQKTSIEITIGFFCAGTPSTLGNAELIKKSGLPNLHKLKSLRFRGEGWPGRWKIEFTGEDADEKYISLSYSESWGFLQKYRQWRCYICPDHTSEFADIAVGDPWYKQVAEDAPGNSLILARTQKGLDFINAAVAAGYLSMKDCTPDSLPLSQPNLIKARGDLWGRLLALKISRAPYPKYHGFATFRFWLRNLTLKQKLQSVFGTFRRIKGKNLRKDLRLISTTE